MNKFKTVWLFIQNMLDLNGGMMMAFFTAAIIYKILTVGLNASDAAAYVGAVGALGYTNGQK